MQSGSEHAADSSYPAVDWVKPNDSVVGATLRLCATFEDGAYGCWRWSDREYVFRLLGGKWRLVAWEQAAGTLDVDYAQDIVRRVFIPVR